MNYAFTLRISDRGLRLQLNSLLMATDAGLVRTDEDIISMGGTAEGVDAALVLRSANSSNFFDLKVKEIICKPAMF